MPLLSPWAPQLQLPPQLPCSCRCRCSCNCSSSCHPRRGSAVSHPAIPSLPKTPSHPKPLHRRPRLNKFLLLILLLSGPISITAQQNPSLPPNYTTILTNDTFKVIRVHYGPHEKVPIHNHPAIPTVFVYLNNSGPVNIIHDQPKPFT